jgi:cell division transport system permease protein
MTAAVLLVSETLVIAATIRLNALCPQRELGIIRLAGASNFSIQLPFVLEGILAESLGAGFAMPGNY